MSRSYVRRDVLKTGLAWTGLATLPGSGLAAQAAAPAPATRIRYCLNTGTIRGQMLSLPQQVETAAQAGYDAIEPWTRDLQAHVDAGGSLADVEKQIADAGLEVPSAIGFANWIVDDDARRAEGLAVARRDMELVRAVGGTRIAAPPAGATDQADLNLLRAAERYRALLELGREIGVVPQLELWGFSKSLHRLGELAFVASEAAHPEACMLPDVYHIYKGGSDFLGLRLLNGRAIHVFHMNDYPAEPPRATINDSHRVYPGDGVAPLTQILRTLFAAGFQGVLSLELFNPDYWKQDPLQVARTGLAKMQAAVSAAQQV